MNIEQPPFPVDHVCSLTVIGFWEWAVLFHISCSWQLPTPLTALRHQRNVTNKFSFLLLSVSCKVTEGRQVNMCCKRTWLNINFYDPFPGVPNCQRCSKLSTFMVCQLIFQTGNSKGYGYVQFMEEEVAKIAAETMNNYLMFEKILKCKCKVRHRIYVSLIHGWDSFIACQLLMQNVSYWALVPCLVLVHRILMTQHWSSFFFACA